MKMKRSVLVAVVLVFGLGNFSFVVFRSAGETRKKLWSAGEEKVLRTRESFNGHWRFRRFGMHPEIPGERIPEPSGLEDPVYDDRTWREIDLPHDWGIEGPFRNDLDNSTALLPWRAIGWYRKHFRLSSQDSSKSIFLDVDGAMANAKVWLNGHYVGEWPYGYTSFRFDLTPYLRFDGENVLAIRLDTEHLDSRWYPGGGIYRNVWLVKTSPLHVAHWGVYITTPEVGEKEARVDVRIDVENQAEEARSARVKVRLLDPSGEVVARSAEVAADIPSMGMHRFMLAMRVEDPQRWDVDHPVLYRAVTEVGEGDRLADVVVTPFGIRTLRFTASDSGFLLNGRRVDIRGVCLHHDLGPLGAAFHVRAAERQLRILKEMGCNAIRTSHNPPAPELLDLCDSLGFLVMEEAFDCWEKGKGKNDYHIHFPAWHEEDLTAMVRRDYNHPSVIMWSIGNEVPDQNNPPLAKRLAAIVHREDPTRPVTAGCNWGSAGFNGFQEAVDVFGYNYNHRSYTRFFTDPGTKHIPFIASETSSCLSSRGEYFFPVREGPINRNLPGKGIFQVSSYDLLYPGWGVSPDSQFVMNEMYPRIMGEFVWTGFDYLGEPTPYNRDVTNLLNYRDPARRARLKKFLNELGTLEVPSRSSYFGINDLCGFRKDRFYLYQSHWRPDWPMAHILPHWNWPERVGKITPVHVYTSGDEAELFLNGRSLGKKKKGPYQYRFRWDSVVYVPGELRVKVWKHGRLWAEDVVSTTGPAAGLLLESDRKEMQADGKDLVFITVRVVDSKGREVPRSHPYVHFSLAGPGRILAVGNGDPTCHEPFKAHGHSVFNGKCLVVVQSEPRPGTLTLKAKAEGMDAGVIRIKVK